MLGRFQVGAGWQCRPVRSVGSDTCNPRLERSVISRSRARRGLHGVLLVFVVGLISACGSDSTGPGAVAQPDGALGPGQAGRWATAAPAAQGLDVAVLVELEDRIDAGEFGEISSLLVLRNGVLVYERYSTDWSADELHRVYSVTKSVASLLMGIAIDEGHVSGVSTPVIDFFPEYTSFANPSPLKAAIRLEDVLQMRTGFKWDELSTNYSSGVNPTVGLLQSSDWIKHVLDLPLTANPGTRFDYNSGVSMLMSGVMRNEGVGSASGVEPTPLMGPLEAYAQARLFVPLGIQDWAWSEGPDDLTNSGWGLQLRPRDMAVLGEMVRRGGVWEGNQVVPQGWLEASARAASQFTDGTGYGYQWWLGEGGSGATGATRSMAAWGWGGQFIIVLPTVDMVLVTTAENFQGGGFDPYTLADFAYRAAG